MLYEASSLPALSDFSVQRGDSWEQFVYLVTHTDGLNYSLFDFPALSNDVKIDLTGISAKLEIRKAGRYIRRITNNGIGGITTERGRIKLTLTAEQTQLLKPDKYQYELRLTLPNGEAITYLKGYFRIVVDQDKAPEDILLVGTLDSLLLLSDNKADSMTPSVSASGNSSSSSTVGVTTTRCFFKSPNGDYFIQWLDDGGSPRYRRDDPTRYSSAIIFLPPLDA